MSHWRRIVYYQKSRVGRNGELGIQKAMDKALVTANVR